MNPAEIERLKELLPTSLGSDELRSSVASDILRRSVFSARMESAHYLAKIRDVCTAILEGTMNQASARNALEGVLDQMGHSMQDGGGLQNPISIRRLNLIVETQTQMASSVNTLMQQTEATIAAWPAWELRRVESRMVPRPDWAARWNLAGASVGWDGALETHIGQRMIALKTSPIWQALGDGVGGFRDTLGNPYPPFAFNSGLGWVEVTAEECERLGLVSSSSSSSSRARAPLDPTADGRARAPRGPRDPTGHGRARAPRGPSLSPGEQDILDAIKRYGIPEIGEGLV